VKVGFDVEKKRKYEGAYGMIASGAFFFKEREEHHFFIFTREFAL
jgi:hypothetical protein